MRPIAISLSPNAQRDDVWLAFSQLLQPWRWNSQQDVLQLEEKFAARFGSEYEAVAVNAGRSAEYLILKTLGISEGDEVIVQAFTCVAVPNSVIWAGAKPVFCDIDDEYNIDSKDLEKKISNKTRAIVVQHTFGSPTDLQSIQKVVRNAEKKYKSKIYIIEDCAHSLGSTDKGRSIGTLGDVAFFSFGRDKVISSVFGGMILVKRGRIVEDVREVGYKLNIPSRFWIFQQLLHPIAFCVILPTYKLGVGKFTLGKGLLVLLQKLRLLSKPVYKKELQCDRPNVFPAKMPGVLARLASNQLNKLDKFNKHRVSIAREYSQKLEEVKVLRLPVWSSDSIWLRYPVTMKSVAPFIDFAKHKGILFGNWYHNGIDPKSNLRKVGYRFGSCPNAEILAKKTVNLPTYPNLSLKQARKVVQLIKQWQNSKHEK